MKKTYIVLFFILGFLLLITGFAYDVVFAGIPFQDPTPEIQERFNHHKSIAGIIMLSGVASLLISAISFTGHLLFFKKRKTTKSPSSR